MDFKLSSWAIFGSKLMILFDGHNFLNDKAEIPVFAPISIIKSSLVFIKKFNA